MKKTTYSLLIAITLIVNFSCSDGNKSEKTEALFLSNWNSTLLPGSNLKIDLPFALNDKPIDIPDQVKIYIKSLISQDYKLESDFYILCATTEYTTDKVSLNNAANESIAGLKMQRTIEDVLFKEESIQVAGAPAKLQSGTYTDAGRPVEFTNVLIMKGARLTSIVITNTAGDAYGKKIREKIVASVRNN